MFSKDFEIVSMLVRKLDLKDSDQENGYPVLKTLRDDL